MYLSFYKLKHKPFQISTDPRFLWLGEKHEEALATLKYGVLDNKGFLLLTGDVGTGKTTLINALINSLDKNTFVASIRDPALDPLEFFQYTAHAFGMKASSINSKIAFLIQFEEFLLEAYKNRRKVLLIIDEAQRISQELLEEVRLLSNIEREESKLLNIFFIGQLEFNEILLRHENRAIRQRVTISYNIETLTKKETREYIKHRLNVASLEKVVSFTPVQKKENGEYVRQGYTLPLSDTREEIFTAEAIEEIYNFARGYPRLTNIICDRALLTGYVEGSRTVTEKHVKECVLELEIPHTKQYENSVKVSEDEAVAGINRIRSNRKHPQLPKVKKPPSGTEKSPRLTEQQGKKSADSSRDDKTASELIGELEKLALKNDTQPELSEQPDSPSPKAAEGSGNHGKKFRNVTYFVGFLILGMLLYYNLSPNASLDNDVKALREQVQSLLPIPEGNEPPQPTVEDAPSTMPQKASKPNTSPQQLKEESYDLKTSENDSPDSDTIPLPPPTPAPLERENSIAREAPPTPNKTEEKGEGETVRSPSSQEVATEEIIAREKAEITQKIQQLKKLVAFQKLIVSFAPGATLPDRESLEKLDNLIGALHSHRSFKVTITYYYADNIENSTPSKLVRFRASAVKNYLTGKGLEAKRISVKRRDKQDISPFRNDKKVTSTDGWVELYVDR